jgi:flagellar biosynthesis GTPase FlhF
MYVRKFEADSLEEALKDIKRELGPDAIILKTLTNKGLKGAFKKKKIEITAAISEKNYSSKAKVDAVLNNDQKEKFYQNDASYISNMINEPAGRSQAPASAGGYGKLALNKQVNSTLNETNEPEISATGLDAFLNAAPKKAAPQVEENPIFAEEPIYDFDSQLDAVETQPAPAPAPVVREERVVTQEAPATSPASAEVQLIVENQKSKIDELEKKLYELTQNVQSINKPQALGVQELVSILRSLDIEETYVQKVVRKANFELSVADKEDPDTVFEFALREMLGEINVGMPLFSSVDNSEKHTVTVVISDVTSGQSTMLRKIASLQKDSMIIRNKGDEDFKENETFSEKFFDIDTKVCRTISEIVSATRTGLEASKNVFVDYKAGNQEVNEVKKFIDGLRRSFENVEVLVCLSSINTELYNRKVLNRYTTLANGMVVTHLDQCLNFGSLFNLAIDFNQLPYKFFGTGQVVPDDLEAATAERILAGIFQL